MALLPFHKKEGRDLNQRYVKKKIILTQSKMNKVGLE
jgi:hypothetical protein